MFDVKKLPRAAFLSIALASPLAACAGAGQIIDDAPALHVAVAGVESEAQLVAQLQALGYRDIRVTGFQPNEIDRRPELSHGFTSADDEDAQVTPVHFGWNGTALKDGRWVDIYVDRARKG
jgi:hypothetical protein